MLRLKNRFTVRVGLLLSLMTLAFNLRANISSVAAVLETIISDLEITTVDAGLLTTLPVLCLGATAPIVSIATAKYGRNYVMGMAGFVLVVGLVVRVFGGLYLLYFGTLLAGLSMGLVGILLPGVIKESFPKDVALVTGLYTAVLCLGGALGAGLSEPVRLAVGGSWRGALLVWAIPAALAVVLWLPFAQDGSGNRRGSRIRGLLSNRLAWQVTGYMGFQSALAYSVFSWLPLMLIEKGMSSVVAGIALAVTIVVQIFSAIGAPIWLKFANDERPTICVLIVLTVLGLFGVLYLPIGMVWVSVVILGIGQGGTFSMALALLALRARDADTASSLSAMAQGFGYIAAACGPFVAGVIRHWSGGWSEVGWFYLFIGMLALICGLGAGRKIYISGLDDV